MTIPLRTKGNFPDCNACMITGYIWVLPVIFALVQIFPNQAQAVDFSKNSKSTSVEYVFPSHDQAWQIKNPGIFPILDFLPSDQNNQTSVLRRRRTLIREQKLGIGANLMGVTLGYASVYLQYSIGKALQFESGADLSAVYGGVILYPEVPLRLEEVRPYMGLMIGYSDPSRNNTAKGIYAYMPVGVRFLTQDDWYICAELAATTASSVKTAPLFLGFKLGYLFEL